MDSLWYVLLYSVLGYGLEMGYALWKTGSPRGRRTLLLLPACPVYGFGAVMILNLPAAIRERWWLLMLWGGLLASCAEYGMGAFYEKVCGVSFWDYSTRKIQLHGRICLCFSCAWGLLSLPMVWWVQPWAEQIIRQLPGELLLPAAVLFGVDFCFTAMLLRYAGGKRTLNWQEIKAGGWLQASDGSDS